MKPGFGYSVFSHFLNKNTEKTETPEVAMRTNRITQTSLFDPQALDHPVADELEWASAWLDEHPELLDKVATDLDGGSGSSRGRHGLTPETVLRCAVLLHLRGESYGDWHSHYAIRSRRNASPGLIRRGDHRENRH